MMKVYWLPTIRSAMELRSNNAKQALVYLKAAAPYDLGSPPQLHHRGIVINFPLGALAHLGLGRAYSMTGDSAKAKAAYQDFLTLWKDADPDIPILKQARAEYAKLQ